MSWGCCHCSSCLAWNRVLATPSLKPRRRGEPWSRGSLVGRRGWFLCRCLMLGCCSTPFQAHYDSAEQSYQEQNSALFLKGKRLLLQTLVHLSEPLRSIHLARIRVLDRFGTAPTPFSESLVFTAPAPRRQFSFWHFISWN
jgi:hypothetical protein